MTEAVGEHQPPPRVRALAGDDAPLAVWRNEAGGITYRLGIGPSVRYLKWQPAHPEISLRREAERLVWARAFLAVPRVIDYGVDTHDTDDGGRPAEWLLTEGLPGRSAVAHPWRERPEIAVTAVGEGLRLLHEALPIESCPWTWRVTDRIADAATRNISVPEDLRDPPPVDQLVVCHGDACCPNTILTEDGACSGHVDLGSLGVADRWADIAVAAMSTEWNYGPGWQDAMVEAYGLDPDPGRMSYYQRLWHAT